jgi:CheY-like chemotaxis protein
MKINGDIILIEDDADDREILIEVFDQVITENNYDNRLVVIEDSSVVINYLKSTNTRPFLLLSDINMPKLDGFALRDQISRDPELNGRCAPYLFLTTTNSSDYISRAHEGFIQGYFAKPLTFSGYKKLIADILSYWKLNLLET